MNISEGVASTLSLPSRNHMCDFHRVQYFSNDLLQSGYEIQKADFEHSSTDTKDIPARKGIQRL